MQRAQTWGLTGSQIDHALGFAHAAFDPALGQQLDLNGRADKDLDVALQLLRGQLGCCAVGGQTGPGLDFDRQVIQGPFTGPFFLRIQLGLASIILTWLRERSTVAVVFVRSGSCCLQFHNFGE